jgi:hypothetical protein
VKFSVEQWQPEYGVPAGPDLPAAVPPVDLSVEVPPRGWGPIRPDAEAVESVLFVDGVRRVDASVWIEVDQGSRLGLCASYAAGAVLCRADSAEIVGCRVERGLFTAVSDAQAISTRHARYPVRPTPGESPEELWLGIQNRMADLEAEVGLDVEADLVVVDGPLSHHRALPRAVGYVKTQHVRYLPDELTPVLASLPVGRRTPLFLVGGPRSGFSWYVRIGSGGGSLGGLARCEITADREVAEAARLADRVTATLPRFASKEHKDPRAPQNLYPVGGLERVLRHRLGDQSVLYRSLRAAAS